MGIVKSGLMKELALISGATPLQWAVSRGDLEIVELLMQHGAEPSIKNDLGRSVMSYVVLFVS